MFFRKRGAGAWRAIRTYYDSERAAHRQKTLGELHIEEAWPQLPPTITSGRGALRVVRSVSDLLSENELWELEHWHRQFVKHSFYDADNSTLRELARVIRQVADNIDLVTDDGMRVDSNEVALVQRSISRLRRAFARRIM